MFEHLYKKIKNSITLAVVFVLIIECATVFFAYSYLNINDYTKKSRHVCEQISAYIGLRLRSYEESTSFFINNNNFESLIKTNSPKTLSLFSQFIMSNIGIRNVFVYDDTVSIAYENNNQITRYIDDKRKKDTASVSPHWDIYRPYLEGTEALMYSYPIKSEGGDHIATFVISISPELLYDNTIKRYENSMTQNTTSFIGIDSTRYCSIDQNPRHYEKAKELYEFSRTQHDYFESYFRVSNAPLENSNLYIQTYVSLKSVFINIFIIGTVILFILLVFSVIAYFIIKSYSNYLVQKLASLSEKIENFSKKEL